MAGLVAGYGSGSDEDSDGPGAGEEPPLPAAQDAPPQAPSGIPGLVGYHHDDDDGAHGLNIHAS